MTKSNLRVLSQPAPQKDKAKSNAANANLTYEIRKELIRLANTIRHDAYALVDSTKIVENFINEIEEIRSKTNLGGRL